jgi:acyl carrier protein
MNMTAQTPITEALEAIIRRFAPQNRGELRLTPSTHLVNEAGIDSPRMIDIVLEVEDQFGIIVDDADIQKVRTFGELVALVGAHTAAEAD